MEDYQHLLAAHTITKARCSALEHKVAAVGEEKKGKKEIGPCNYSLDLFLKTIMVVLYDFGNLNDIES